MKRKEINARRIKLAEIKKEDKVALICLLTNPEVGKTYMVPALDTDEVKDALFGRFLSLSSQEGKFVYGIYLDGKLIGIIHEVCAENNEIELGYVIDPAEKGKGYATEALYAAIKALFADGFSAVVTGAFEENAASIRVMEKCGMKRTDQTEDTEYRGATHKCVYYKITNR